MTPLSQKIITTLAYYDAMDYPMTPFEIWKYLISDQETTGSKQERERVQLLDIIKGLESEEVKKHIDQYHGYYFLKGRPELVEKRLENNKIAEVKLKKTRRVVWLLRFVPFVRMVAVTGTMAMKNSQRKSDLDLLIVLRHGYIFTGRTLVTLTVHLLGRRRYGKKITDRICLNFFTTDQSLKTDLREIFVAENRSDMEAIVHFCASEHFFILPLFDRQNFEKFQKENSWIKNYLENFQPELISNSKKIPDSFISGIIRSLGEYIFSFNFIENWLKSWQIERIMKDPRTHMSGAMVMADDNALIFLPKPQGPEVFEKFQEKLSELKIA